MEIKEFVKLVPQYLVYPKSLCTRRETNYAIVRNEKKKFLAVTGTDAPLFQGTSIGMGEGAGAKLCNFTRHNCQTLRNVFPELTPKPCDRKISFGFGDRLGIATPAHLVAINGRDIFPVFAQQSIRENTRTGRSYQEVLDDAVWGCFQDGHRAPFGADADHLKEPVYITEALHAGFSMYTIDISDHMRNPAVLTAEGQRAALLAVRDADTWEAYFNGKKYTVGGMTYTFTEPVVRRLLITFAAGLDFATDCYERIKHVMPVFDFEVSVDETSVPTEPIDHIFVAEYLRKAGVVFTSLAPRFPGEFEKAIDYKGSVPEFKDHFRMHTEISRFFGGYKVSIHSGSDKFAVYPAVKETSDSFHIKTAGTSWLQAVRTLAVRTPGLYRKIHQCALNNLEKDRVGYVIHLDTAKIPPLEKTPDSRLEDYFELPDSRQLIHITYGSVLAELKDDILRELLNHEDECFKQIAGHLGKHLDLLLS